MSLYQQANLDHVRKAAASPQASVRQRAAAVLKLLGGDDMAGSSTAPRSAQRAPVADLMGGMDEQPGPAADLLGVLSFPRINEIGNGCLFGLRLTSFATTMKSRRLLNEVCMLDFCSDTGHSIDCAFHSDDNECTLWLCR